MASQYTLKINLDGPKKAKSRPKTKPITSASTSNSSFSSNDSFIDLDPFTSSDIITPLEIANLSPPLPWDGTDLGILIDYNIIKAEYKNYYKDPDKTIVLSHPCNIKLLEFILKINGNRYYALGYKTKTKQPCLADQLKSCFNFNLKPIGSHIFTYNNNKYFIINYPPELHQFIPLSIFQGELLTPEYEFKIKMLFMIRDIIGVYRNSESTIFIDPNQIIDPFSLYENIKETMESNNDTVLSKTCVDKWFKTNAIRKFIQLQSGGIKEKDIPEYINNIRGKLEDVIVRVDKELVSCINALIYRLNVRLMSM